MCDNPGESALVFVRRSDFESSRCDARPKPEHLHSRNQLRHWKYEEDGQKHIPEMHREIDKHPQEDARQIWQVSEEQVNSIEGQHHNEEWVLSHWHNQLNPEQLDGLRDYPPGEEEGVESGEAQGSDRQAGIRVGLRIRKESGSE